MRRSRGSQLRAGGGQTVTDSAQVSNVDQRPEPQIDEQSEADVFVVWALDRPVRSGAPDAHRARPERTGEFRDGIDAMTAAGPVASHISGAMTELERPRDPECAEVAAAKRLRPEFDSF